MSRVLAFQIFGYLFYESPVCFLTRSWQMGPQGEVVVGILEGYGVGEDSTSPCPAGVLLSVTVLLLGIKSPPEQRKRLS